MAGHGYFVWSAYVISFFIILLLALLPRLRKRAVRTQVQRHARIVAGNAKQHQTTSHTTSHATSHSTSHTTP